MSIQPDDDTDRRCASPALGYYLPEHSQYQLARLRNFLQFLSQLTAPRTLQEEAGQLNVSPDDLAYCFHLLATELEPVLRELEGPAHVTLTYLAPTH